MNDHDTTMQSLKDVVQEFVAEREWEPFHDAKNLAMSISIEAAELMEHVQWLRSEEITELQDDAVAMEGIREEIADVFCYVISFASAMGIDLSSALADKMVKNRIKYPASEFKGRFRRSEEP
jgi:NTP pyrophosphatase (non-canonical NTP hydrolase)